MFTEIEQRTLDISRFFTNNDDLAFVASGGGKLPQSVAKSCEDVDLLYSYFESLDDQSDIIINPDFRNNCDT
jgi:hypothetical protein